MGIIIRQGLSSSILIYLGMVLGFVISVLLFPKTLGTEVYGFTQWLVNTSYTLSIFSLFGLHSVTVKYFPYFNDKPNGHGGYLFFLLLMATVGLAVANVLLFSLKPFLLSIFQDERSEGFVSRYFLLIPVMLAVITYFEAFRAYASALLRPRVPMFFSQLANRLMTLLLIGLFFFAIIDTDQFIRLFAFKNGLSIVALFFFFYLIGELHLRPNWSIFRRPILREMGRFSIYAIFAQIGNQIITKIDILMVGPLLDFEKGGIYTVFVLLTTVIALPHDGIATITSPLIARAFKEKNLAEVKSLYRRTAMNNFILSVLLYIGIWSNLDNLVEILGEQYRIGTTAAIFLGAAQLVQVMNGYSGYVIIHSPYYRFDLLLKLFTCVVTAASNYFLIRWYGLTGAAIATAATIIFVNLASQYFIYRKFGFHPFSWATVKALLIGALGLAIGLLLPNWFSFYAWDIILRSTFITLAYGVLILGLKVSPDINNFTAAFIRKATGWDPTFLRH